MAYSATYDRVHFCFYFGSVYTSGTRTATVNFSSRLPDVEKKVCSIVYSWISHI